MRKERNKKSISPIILVVVCFFIFFITESIIMSFRASNINKRKENTLNILSSYENADLEETLIEYAQKEKITLHFTYMGDLDIVSELNTNSKNYDAVWISNSMWLYMLDNSYLTSDAKSISISPVVFGVKKSKANSLNLTSDNITNEDILNLIRNKSLKYVMSSVTQTNTGATAYIGFLNSLAGNPEVLTEEYLKDKNLTAKLIELFSGVERVSGDENFLEEMFINSNDYEAVLADEASLIHINQVLKSKNMEELYLIYPKDGVAINDSTFAFINNDKKKEESFLKIQNYLLSDEGQQMLTGVGRRTWYGGVNNNVNKEIFNPDWGIDTTKYLNVTRFPSKKVITEALDLYIETLRKPTHTVFCLDYSGSMYGDGIKELSTAMDYILDYEKAKEDKLQFSSHDKITVIIFSSTVTNIWTIENGQETEELRKNINSVSVSGSTALYDAIEEGLKILNEETDNYTKTIIAMTDGEVNIGSYLNLSSYYVDLKKDIPVYSITFGSANESQLERIARLTNAKVFNGKTNLLQAFKEVRTYN